jgi:hypothetical protein
MDCKKTGHQGLLLAPGICRRPDNHPQRLVLGKVSDSPVEQGHYPVSIGNQGKKMYEQPCHPGNQTVEVHFGLGKIRHGLISPDNGHRTFVMIEKRL